MQMVICLGEKNSPTIISLMVDCECSPLQRKLVGRIKLSLTDTMADGACLYASRRNYRFKFQEEFH